MLTVIMKAVVPKNNAWKTILNGVLGIMNVKNAANHIDGIAVYKLIRHVLNFSSLTSISLHLRVDVFLAARYPATDNRTKISVMINP